MSPVIYLVSFYNGRQCIDGGSRNPADTLTGRNAYVLYAADCHDLNPGTLWPVGGGCVRLTAVLIRGVLPVTKM